MKSKNVLCGLSVAVALQLGVLAVQVSPISGCQQVKRISFPIFFSLIKSGFTHCCPSRPLRTRPPNPSFRLLIPDANRRAGRTAANKSASPHRPQNSWAMHAITALCDVLYPGFDFRLEVVSQFQPVFEQMIQPVAQSLLLCGGQPLHLLFDLFKY